MGLGFSGRKKTPNQTPNPAKPSLEVEKCKIGLTSITVRILPLQGSCTDLT